MGQQFSRHYFFDGDEVVFEFDSREYLQAKNQDILERLDFSDLKIDEVVVSGNFNNWSKDSWKMRKTGRYTYQLRKKIVEFNDPFKWEFKFLVNGEYWIVPDAKHPGKKFLSNDFIESTYNLKLNDIESDSTGNTLFYLKGYPEAKKVILAGSFDNWDENQLKMQQVADGWQLRINLSPGRHEYKFIVDGNWMHDSENPNAVKNEHHTLNSVLFVNKLVQFKLEKYPRAQKVILAGSFNNWNENDHKMQRQDGAWTTALELAAGKHYYKFIVDGKWIVDPVNTLQERDREGNLNSVLIVR
ncbi:MAG: hypothetical protein DHS20C18_17310 [Saprospiraceae bacterium]|nr:MAG: hypothetical protein DHS20C18_17310 [Saprospiraceae bacterium]